MTTSDNGIFGQSTGPLPPLSKLPAVKIITPSNGDIVEIENPLSIHGISSDDDFMNCLVSVIVNNIKPYQRVSADGLNGSNDYSRWSYTLTDNYTTLNDGTNKLTSKIACADNNINTTKWYSVNITGRLSGISTQMGKEPNDTTDKITTNSTMPSANMRQTSDSGKNLLPQSSIGINNNHTKLSSNTVIQQSNRTSSSPSVSQSTSVENFRVPIADAGPDQTATSGSTVTLDGSRSNERDGKIVSYSWVQMSDLPDVALQNADSPVAKFEVPDVKVNTNLDFKLLVVDNNNLSNTDITRVIVTPISQKDGEATTDDVPCERIGITNSC
ncbi:MAG TPA: PKD domain-containing protein [Nitrososphaeraceae archaeon]